MKKYLLVLGVILVIIFGCSTVDLRDVSYSVVGINGTGSGVIISSGKDSSLLLTNRHVCEINKATIKYMDYVPFSIKSFSTGNVISGTVVKVSLNYDLCLIKIDKGDLVVATIADSVIVGQKIINISAPMGVPNYKVDGYLGQSFFMNFNRYYQISTPLYPGSSGSGVFNEDKELVGLGVATLMGANEISFMVPLSDIKMFIRTHVK